MKTGIETIEIQELENGVYELYLELQNGKLVAVAIGNKAAIVEDLQKLIKDLESM